MKLELGQRSCQIGPSINSRTQKAGNEDVGALDIPLSRIVLDAGNFDAVMLEQGAWDRLFIDPIDQKPIAPIFPHLAPFTFREKVGGFNITLFLGSKSLLLEGVTLKGITLELEEGGMAHMSATLQCLREQVARTHMLEQLFDFQNKQIQIIISCEEYGEHLQPLEEPKSPDQSDFVDGPLDKPKQTGKKRPGRPRKPKPELSEQPTGSDD